MIPYGRQNITDEDIEEVVKVLKSDFLTQGPSILKFEQEFAEYVDAKYAVAVNNGTAALHLSVLSLGVTSKSRVITTPITFAATANSVRYCGGKIYFADIDPETYLLDIRKVRELLENHPKGFFDGIIPVDFAGRAVNMESFRKLANEYGCWIIEDACHAPGGFFEDSLGVKQLCGSNKFSDLAIFSFHPVKHIACGEGGMITTNSEELYQKLLLLRTHGITKSTKLLTENHGGWYYEMKELGFNYRLTDFQAALGCSQLKRANDGLNKRNKLAKKYSDFFSNMSFIIRHSGFVHGHAYHLYIIEVENRKELYEYLKSNNIYCQVHYIPLHKMPYYKGETKYKIVLNYAENYYQHCLSLPMYPSLSDKEQNFVIDHIKLFFTNKK